MHRLLLVVAASVALAACGHSKASGPKWPEPSAKDEDGGESIAPRPSAQYAAAVEKSTDVDDDKPGDAKSDTPATTSSGDTPAAAAAATSQPASDEPIMTDEIIIEIDE
jgi:hypothetical protein